MRAWPSDLRGLVLQLPAGWYELPHYMTAAECRRLVELLCAGLDGVEYLVELDWDNLGDDGDAQQLSKSVVVLSLPADVRPDEELLRVLRTQLGSVRVGLLQHRARRTWADVAWQERHVKVPLLSWLKQRLRDPGHPFARLGVDALPVDELAKLTPEPVELLVLVDGVLAHRLRHRAQGMEEADWGRSVHAIVAERLAHRLQQLPREQLPQILDLLRSQRHDALVRELDARELGLELARVGLAWHEGGDVLLGPLAKLVGRDEVLEHLGRLLPVWTWSEAGKRALGRVAPPFMPLPRASLIAPEPNYAAWPAVEPELYDMAYAALGSEPNDSVRAELAAMFREEINAAVPRRQLSIFSLAGFKHPDEIGEMGETMRVAMSELHDDALIELDLARGRIHRFDAADRRFSDTTLGARFRAYLRWRGVSVLLGRAHERDHLATLVDEVERGIELTHDPSDLRGALECLAGDLYASAHDYRRAIDWWTRARAQFFLNEDLGEDDALEDDELLHPEFALCRPQLRCALAWLRLDDVQRARDLTRDPLFDHYEQTAQLEDRLALDLLRQLLELDVALDARMDGSATALRSLSAIHRIAGERAPRRLAWAAAALELEDWAGARHLVAELIDEDDATPTELERARLLDAHLMIASGEADRAGVTFETLADAARERGDTLLEALALRGLAIAGLTRSDPAPSLKHLARAAELERALGLPDAELVEFELRGWQTLTHPETEPLYSEHAKSLAAAGSASLRLAAHASHFQRMCVAISAARQHRVRIGGLTGIIDAIELAAEQPQPSSWVLRAVRELLAYVSVMAGAHEPAELTRVEALAPRLGVKDNELLAWLRSDPAAG